MIMTKHIRSFLKITLLTIAAALVILMILGNIGGNGKEFQQTVEGFASDATGHPAQISQMHNLRFFPNIILHFNTMRFFESEENKSVIGSIGEAHMVMSFWDVLQQNGKFKYIYIKNAYIEPGTLLEKDITINDIQILEPEQNKPILSIDGAIGEYPVLATLPLNSKGQLHHRVFSLAWGKEFLITLGELHIKGTVNFGQHDLSINDISIDLKNEALFSDIDLKINSQRIVSSKNMELSKLDKLETYLRYIFSSQNDSKLFTQNDTGQIQIFGHALITQPKE